MNKWPAVLLLWSVTSACASPLPPVPFPNPLAPLLGNLSADEVVQKLYGSSEYAPDIGACVQSDPCQLSVKKVGQWTQDGQDHWGVVVVAEAKTAAHADGALIGMIDLIRSGDRWLLSSGSPVVAIEGSFGEAPAVDAFVADQHLVLVTYPAFMDQGQSMGMRNFYLHTESGWQRVLSLRDWFDSSGYCQKGDSRCLKNDFQSKFAYETRSDGFILHQAITVRDGRFIKKDYRCDVPKGVCE